MNQDECYKLTRGQLCYKGFKNVADRIVAAVGAVVLSPVFLIIMLAIKLEDGWNAPVFFQQKRVGLEKNHFMLYKFRSMKLDTPSEVPTHLLTNPEQYITKVGRILRKTSLDELPQLINIIKGDIYICGPRPALWNQFDLIEERDKYNVHQIKPGLTGWAQVNGRDALEIDDKARYDGEYVRNFGFPMDLKCYIKTIYVVLTFVGVIEGGTGAMEAAAAEEEKRVG